MLMVADGIKRILHFFCHWENVGKLLENMDKKSAGNDNITPTILKKVGKGS